MNRRSVRGALGRRVITALRSFDLEAVTAASLKASALDPDAPVRVIAMGKAAASMAHAISRARDVHAGVLIVPQGAPPERLGSKWTVLRAAHPIPNASSVVAGKAVLTFAKEVSDVPLIVLVSGGASALACAPHADTTLREKKRVTRALLARGASIAEINTVRKHLSLLKGGGLLAAARAASVHTIAVADVIGGTLSDIASGPSVPNESTVSDARRIARHYALGELPFHPTPALSSRVHKARTRAAIASSPEHFATYLGASLRSFGKVRVLRPRVGSVFEMAESVAALANRIRPGEVIVYASEPTVLLPPRPGKGGRSCHLAALVAERLPSNVCFLALGTDGADGTSGTAGAVVDASLASHPLYRSSLAQFDTARLHRAAGTALETGLTGLNFADMHVLARV